MAHVLAFFQGPYSRPYTNQPSYPLLISSILVSPKRYQCRIYINMFSLAHQTKTCIITPTEDERFSQHITTVNLLKFPSVFRPPGSIPFVALHIFLYHDMLKIYQIQAQIVRQFISISAIKATVTPIASMSAVKFTLNILLTIKTIST